MTGKTEDVKSETAISTIESSITLRLSRGPASWDDLKSFATDGYEASRFGIAVTRVLNSGRIRAVGCEPRHGCRSGCRFEVVC